jgi:hypothetical protein
MAYPNAEDYVRAVQQPERVFQSPALRQAVFDVHPVFRIPMPASGNAAVVFKAQVEGRDSALRFFIREDASSRERYSALGRHFRARSMVDCVASASWVDDAIAVNGSTWPMVQMQWVEGRTLDAYVGHLASRGDVGALAQLAGTWRHFVDRLQAAEFAHGDLQHGNVLVDASSTLRLVDFDGSWIAAFRGGPPPKETGHPNYQRTGREWGRWMDTFPGLVIYTALLALSRRPMSWEELHNGENMLFSQADFIPPFSTRTWTLLSGIRDPEVDHAARRLMLACTPGWRAEDTLESLLDSRPRIVVPPPRQPAQEVPYTGFHPSAGPATPWWDQAVMDHSARSMPRSGSAGIPPHAMPPPPPKMPPPPPKTGAGAGPAWHPSHADGSGGWHSTGGPVPPWPPPQQPPRPGLGPWHTTPPGAPGGRRPVGAVGAITAFVAVLCALLVGGLTEGAAGEGGAAAALLTAFVVLIALPPLLRRKKS